MYSHLTEGKTLPPSQVVRTVPGGAVAPPITTPNVPNILNDPAAGDRIVFQRDTLFIPYQLCRSRGRFDRPRVVLANSVAS
jgi:hydroxybutyrate-dimer hydrolase